MATGAGLLFGSWRKRLSPGWAWNTAGWLTIAGSCWSWAAAMGVEYGLVMTTLVLPLAAWFFVVTNRRVREPKAERIQPASLGLPPLRSLLRHLGLFFLSVPLAGIASILGTLVLAGWLPWHETAQLAFVILFVPVAWGLLAWWVTADRRAWRPGLTIAVLALAAGIALYA